MTLNEDDRNILIDHRMNKARELISEIQIHIDNSHYITAVNRIYYAIFYALSALALKNNFPTSKHQQLIGWFNKSYIKENIIDRKYGKIVNSAFEMRTRGDYDDFINYKKEDIINLFNDMKEFLIAIKKII